jgi:hypothetical protein
MLTASFNCVLVLPSAIGRVGTISPYVRIFFELNLDFLVMTRDHPRRWSFKEEQRLMELARSSQSLEEIVKATGRSPDSIKKIARRIGVSIKEKDAPRPLRLR